MCVVSSYIEKNFPQYEILDCKASGVSPFWGKSKAFCVWTPDNRQNQKKFYQRVHEKIAEADVFIFQDHSGLSVIPELTTEYLHDNVATGLKICVPDTRFFAHLNTDKCLEPYVDYVKLIHKERVDIIKYLQVSDDPKLTELLKNEWPMKKNFVYHRNENTTRYEQGSEKYDINIDMNNWMEARFRHQTFTETHSHPDESYFAELIQQLYKHLDINIDTHHINNVPHPAGHRIIDPNQFKFFRDHFPDIRVNFEGEILRPNHPVFRL